MVSQLQKLPAVEKVGTLEPVAHFDGAMLTGVTVSHQGRIFVNFPKWGDEVEFTVAEIREGKAVAYPNQAFNQTQPDNLAAALVSVQSVVVDPADRLWILDTGSPLFQPTQFGGPKLVCVDLTSDRVIKTILFPQDVALPTTYLNDIRFDLRRGTEGMAFITDSSDQGANGIIVVDLASGERDAQIARSSFYESRAAVELSAARRRSAVDGTSIRWNDETYKNGRGRHRH